MFLFSLIFFTVMLLLVGAGIAIGLVVCLITAALLGLGVLSSSLFLGLRSGHFSVGFRALLLQCGLLAGIPSGMFCVWLVQTFMEAYGNGWPVLFYGALGGMAGGVIVALFLDFIARRFQSWASARLPSLPRR